MKEKQGKDQNRLKLRGILLLSLVWLSVLFSGKNPEKVMAAEPSVLETNVTEAAEGNFMIGVPGIFYSTEENEMLDRMNEVRKEAYNEKLEYPKGSGKHLGVDYPYVSLKWSNKCERIARIRAAEVSLLAGHVRPCGGIAQLSLEGFSQNGEVIAWDDTVLNGIWNKENPNDPGSWYSEKKYYIDPADTTHVTGHYTAMIDPDNTYVGISAFQGSSAFGYLNSWKIITGEFSPKESLDETFVGLQGEYIQKVEVKAGYVSMKIVGNNALDIDEGTLFETNITVNTTNGYGSNNCRMYSPVKWTSSNEDVLVIDEATGIATGKAEGRVKITATAVSGGVEVSDTLDVVVLPAGIAIEKLIAPEPITVNTGTKPELPKSVTALLTNGATAEVAVSWEEPVADFYKKNSYLYYQDTSFDVMGTFQEFTVAQKVNVIAQIERFDLETDTVTVESGQKPVYPKAKQVCLTNGMAYKDSTINWTDHEEYKKREGGTFEIEGVFPFNTTKKAKLTLIVNPATVTSAVIGRTTIVTATGKEPEYPKATVTWSNGDVEETEISWDQTEDFKEGYKRSAGTSYTITGSCGGKHFTVTVLVKTEEEAGQDIKDGQEGGNGSGDGNGSDSGTGRQDPGNDIEQNTGNPRRNRTDIDADAKPVGTSITKLKAGRKAFTVKWEKASGEINGYQIQYSTKKNFKSGVKKVTVKKAAITSKKIKAKAGRRYYVRIRTYRIVNGKYLYSDWSKGKKIKV